MKCENAQELYSDYAESVLSPAMKLAMEQHLESCPACRQDLEAFQMVVAILNEGLPEVEAPAGFAQSVMGRIEKSSPSPAASRRAQPADRESFGSAWRRFAQSLIYTPRRAFATGVACTLVAVAAFGGIHGVSGLRQSTKAVNSVSAEMWPVPVQHTSGILQNAVTESLNGQTFHVFGIHLPLNMPTAQIKSYVLQNGSGLTDDSALNNTDNATLAWSGTGEQGVSIHVPVAVVSSVLPGTTLNFLVEWTPMGNDQTEQKEAAFVPISDEPANPVPVSAGDTLYDVLQNISSTYNAKIFVDPSAVTAAAGEAQVGTSDLAALTGTEGSARAALQTALSSAGYFITQQSDGSFLISHP